jgi:hypothetical protein
MRLIKKPFKWVSAHRDIEFTFIPDNIFTLFGVGSSNDKAVFSYITNGFYTPVVGQRILILTGIYKGYHTITAVGVSNIFGVLFQELTTDSPFIGVQNAGSITFPVPSLSFRLYKGGQALSMLYPVELIAEFSSEINLDGRHVVNISGYVNKIFDVINSNDSYEPWTGFVIKPNTFNCIELQMSINGGDYQWVSSHRVLNAAIDMFELNQKYVDTGLNLNDYVESNFYFSCGDTENIQIVGDYVKVVGQYIDGVLQTVSPYFDSGFDSGFFHG